MEKQKLKLNNKLYTYIYKWEVKNPKKVLHLIHGSKEHIGRYKAMIAFLNNDGISVYGSDLRGHGLSAKEQNTFGHIDDPKEVREDIEKINKLIEKENPNVEIVMYGHSMGSFLLRYFLKHNKGYSAIISGTNNQSTLVSHLGIWIINVAKVFKGKKKKNILLDKMSYRAFSKQVKTGNWLSNDPLVMKEFNEDKLNATEFTDDSFKAMLYWLKEINKPESYKGMKGRLLIAAGSQDPVGQKGKGPTNAFKKYVQAGSDVKIRIYKEGRHEIHNDTNKEEVWADYSKFILNKK